MSYRCDPGLSAPHSARRPPVRSNDRGGCAAQQRRPGHPRRRPRGGHPDRQPHGMPRDRGRKPCVLHVSQPAVAVPRSASWTPPSSERRQARIDWTSGRTATARPTRPTGIVAPAQRSTDARRACRPPGVADARSRSVRRLICRRLSRGTNPGIGRAAYARHRGGRMYLILHWPAH